ncbi:restriction endonuclease subunit S, partial [Streptococcus respiraculi]
RRVKYSTLQQLDLYMPNALDEKIQIGRCMNQIDRLITLHQRKLDKLKDLKKAYLNELFV